MRVGLFVPCYVDQLYPQVAVATLQLLERLGCTVEVPLSQTCCGQPMANAGHPEAGLPATKHTARLFEAFDYVVGPSGSCVLHLQQHAAHLAPGLPERTYELCAFLTDVLEVSDLDARFPHKVGVLASCHGLRGLRLGSGSERGAPDLGKIGRLLRQVDDLELVEADRPDECCGFGGTFAITEEAVSVKMGRDRVRDFLTRGAEVLTGTDVSCLMHLDGLVRRAGPPLRTLHVAEILNAVPR